MTDPIFTGRTALVTGAGAGIGRASASAFAARGARVMLCDIDKVSAEETAQLIVAAGGVAEAMQCDATDWESVERLVNGTVGRFGSLDFAHNNVGCGVSKPFEELTEKDYHWISDVTFKSAFLGLRFQLPIMRARRSGAIVNTASMAGLSTVQSADMVYAGAKAAVIHITAYAARLAGAEGVRVNCIAPGLVGTKIVNEMFTLEEQTEMCRTQLFTRTIRPEEIAASVIFLCSDEAAMISGMCLPVDGGMNAIK